MKKIYYASWNKTIWQKKWLKFDIKQEWETILLLKTIAIGFVSSQTLTRVLLAEEVMQHSGKHVLALTFLLA